LVAPRAGAAIEWREKDPMTDHGRTLLSLVFKILTNTPRIISTIRGACVVEPKRCVSFFLRSSTTTMVMLRTKDLVLLDNLSKEQENRPANGGRFEISLYCGYF
jgi:hypothetical protein